MKKTLYIVALLAIVCMAFSSCRSSKPACPAYSSVNVTLSH